MEGTTPLEYPEAGDDVRELYIFVQELCKQANRSWTVKPDGVGKFMGSDETVKLVLNPVIATGNLNGARASSTLIGTTPTTI